MRGSNLRTSLLGGAAIVGLTLPIGAAWAGGFINQSQSTVYNGSAYSGYGAPGHSPSGMFINPAIMTEFTGITSESNFSIVAPSTRIQGLSPFGGSRPSGDISQDVFVPASYVIVPLGYGFTFGVALNAPFGSITKPDPLWGGRFNSQTTKARTININPAISYQITPEFSIGVGVQFQWMKASFVAQNPLAPLGGTIGVEGDGWGYGLTAGATWKPFQGTAIGLGYRSRIDQELEGEYVNTPLPARLATASTTVRLPDRLNLSLRQMLTSQWDLLASVEWHNWSRIGSARLVGPGVALLPASLRQLSFNYRDGWFFALGSEYRWNEFLTLRGGAAYEISPVTNAVRDTRLPDNDRFWLSAGLSYQLAKSFSVNASYSRVFVKGADINIGPPTPYVGKARSYSDIFSVGFSTNWSELLPGVLPRTVFGNI